MLPIASMSLGRTTLADLHRWLVATFNAAELRRVVRFGPRGEQVTTILPERCLAELAFEVVMAWQRYGVKRKTLFMYLAKERPLTPPLFLKLFRLDWTLDARRVTLRAPFEPPLELP